MCNPDCLSLQEMEEDRSDPVTNRPSTSDVSVAETGNNQEPEADKSPTRTSRVAVVHCFQEAVKRVVTATYGLMTTDLSRKLIFKAAREAAPSLTSNELEICLASVAAVVELTQQGYVESQSTKMSYQADETSSSDESTVVGPSNKQSRPSHTVSSTPDRTIIKTVEESGIVSTESQSTARRAIEVLPDEPSSESGSEGKTDQRSARAKLPIRDTTTVESSLSRSNLKYVDENLNLIHGERKATKRRKISGMSSPVSAKRRSRSYHHPSAVATETEAHRHDQKRVENRSSPTPPRISPTRRVIEGRRWSADHYQPTSRDGQSYTRPWHPPGRWQRGRCSRERQRSDADDHRRTVQCSRPTSQTPSRDSSVYQMCQTMFERMKRIEDTLQAKRSSTD